MYTDRCALGVSSYTRHRRSVPRYKPRQQMHVEREAAGSAWTGAMSSPPLFSISSSETVRGGQQGPRGPGAAGTSSPHSKATMPWRPKPQGAPHGTPLPASAPRRHTPTRARGPAHGSPQPTPEKAGPSPSAKDNGGDRSEMDRQPRERRLVLGEAGPGVGLPQALDGGGDAEALTADGLGPDRAPGTTASPGRRACPGMGGGRPLEKGFLKGVVGTVGNVIR